MLLWFFALAVLLISVQATDDDEGLTWLGTFETLAHGVNGEVYAEDDHTLVIKSFVYDGESEDAFFVLTKTDSVEEPFEYLTDELGSKEPLGTYMNEDIRLRLRPGTSIGDYKTLSVYCNKYKVDFGHVVFGKFAKPLVRRMKSLGKFVNAMHGVSGQVMAIDESTILIKNFNFDGASEDGQFVLYKNPQMINASMEVMADEEGSTNPLVLYRDMDVILSLKAGAKLSMYKGLSVYCNKYHINFGNVDFPAKMRLPRGPRRRSIKPRSLGQLLNNQGTHNVSGTLFHVDEKTLLITRFFYDGMSPDGQFVLSRKDVVQEPVEMLADERGNTGPLRKYNGQDIFLTIPSDLDINDFKAFSVYCAKYKLDFGHAIFPVANQSEKPFSLLSAKVNMAGAKKLGSFSTIAHGVQGEVYALDEATLFIKNFTYDGTSPDGKFVLSKTETIAEPFDVLADEWGMKNDGLLEYNGKNIVVKLNKDTKISDFKALSVWCNDYKLDFGHVIFGQDMSGLAQAKVAVLSSGESMW
ncbi:skeletor [Ramazzottius varieornatus]|uniref:Skeletor n=1 Tax=Ramazzottius varieornatus TaxID=947166 RepID=A0A1D1W4R3_RAMVA|nr:skeletor [Ramazzottius varieornatus]